MFVLNVNTKEHIRYATRNVQQHMNGVRYKIRISDFCQSKINKHFFVMLNMS